MIPAAIADCLASTGSDSWLPLIGGMVVVAAGVAVFLATRRRLRTLGTGLMLVALLAAGGGLLAVAPSAPAQAAECSTPTPTPAPLFDYSINATIAPTNDTAIPTGGTAVITFSVTNEIADQAGTPPIVVRIPKSINISTPSATLTAPSTDWALDSVTDPANFVFTYTGALAAGATTPDATFTFTALNGNFNLLPVPVSVTIDTGSGGDTVVTNNQIVVEMQVQGVPA